ncbi:DUF2158 domain-containing protein [Aquimarina hainanensis]|uniref:DUF2158 domain-containing protein n=1 Tax=Aquimarina hainanensis TaxID=1578017 RepID=A0ABW5NEU7_9FLAO
MKFQKDDIVKLKDSETKMTVTSVDNNEYVSCKWINRLGHEMHGQFPGKLLTKN